jgi:hypothetical protein
MRRAIGRFPTDSRLIERIDSLVAGSGRFCRLVGLRPGHRQCHKVIAHPQVGPITVDRGVLTDGDTELKIVIYSAATDTEYETKLRLAVPSGSRRPLAADPVTA